MFINLETIVAGFVFFKTRVEIANALHKLLREVRLRVGFGHNKKLAKQEWANKSNTCFADKVKNDTLAAAYLNQPPFSFKSDL